MSVLGVLLAAGGGHRFAASGGDGPKQLALLDGEPLAHRALRAALDAGMTEVVVVEGAVELSSVVDEVTRLHNPRWSEGLATSLQVGLAHARNAGHDAVVVGLADQPDVTAQAWAAVATAPPDPPIAVATYDGRRGNPVRLHEKVWELLPTTGDEGAKALMRKRPSLVRDVSCPGSPGDIDTMEDLQQWS